MDEEKKFQDDVPEIIGVRPPKRKPAEGPPGPDNMPKPEIEGPPGPDN